MTELIKPKYVIETTGIEVTNQNGRRRINLADLDLRVKDYYTGMPIGGVIAVGGTKYEANFFFAKESDQCILTAPEGGWGTRFDLAATAIWKKYSEGLPWHERTKRWMWRWMGVGWFLFGTAWGVLLSLIGQSLIGSDG